MKTQFQWDSRLPLIPGAARVIGRCNKCSFEVWVTCDPTFLQVKKDFQENSHVCLMDKTVDDLDTAFKARRVFSPEEGDKALAVAKSLIGKYLEK